MGDWGGVDQNVKEIGIWYWANSEHEGSYVNYDIWGY